MNYADPKRFGYYTVGTHSIFSKVEALEMAQRLNQPIEFHYNDEIFDSLDWTKEPKKDLRDLYQDRAKQIRNNYDYVVLFYSGGADSHNMLESFLNAGVPIDEVVSFHSLSADGDRQSEFNREIFETAIPYVESLKLTQRLSNDTPHRLIDMSDIITKFCKDINWLDFPYMVSSTLSINNVARSYLRRYVTDWADKINQGKRLVLVWGHDKPRIMSDGPRFFLNFMDIFDNCVSNWVQQTSTAGWFDEMFYSTPDMPQLVVKQAHTIKRFLEVCNDTHPWVTESVTGLGHAVKYSKDGSYKSIWLTQDAQSMLIYPWFRPDLYYESKPKDIIFSKRDRWFWQDKVISSQYHNVVSSLKNQFGEAWINEDPTRGIRATRNFRSKKYWLSH